MNNHFLLPAGDTLTIMFDKVPMFTVEAKEAKFNSRRELD